MRRIAMLAVFTMLVFATPTVAGIATNDSVPRETVHIDASGGVRVIGFPTDGSGGPDVQLESFAEAHNYYTCRRDFHVHGDPPWFISYQGWYWKDRDGASRQVYVHKHYWLKPYSEHYRHTWCT